MRPLWVSYFPLCRFVLLCSSMSPCGSCTNPGKLLSMAQRCSASLKGNVLVQAFPGSGASLPYVWAGLSQDVGSLKPEYLAASSEAWTFPAQWGEARELSYATSPMGWQKGIKHGARGRKMGLIKASVIRLQKSQGLKENGLFFFPKQEPFLRTTTSDPASA